MYLESQNICKGRRRRIDQLISLHSECRHCTGGGGAHCHGVERAGEGEGRGGGGGGGGEGLLGRHGHGGGRGGEVGGAPHLLSRRN